ncbi:MAG: Asp-tRNA(Asn)/Glu-tRNA(Gln) amidotransferase GatCAB subunit C, partial [Actinobacteria bacterium]|nr:Asp-tRNA(Asn)/Glu-tRNA(Gln) amidotransferase GatCAB subunit C [Actinomycetota bacterium]
MLRSHEAGSLRASHIGQTVTLAGWVSRRRDHGGVAFIDLRDASGSVQVVIRDEKLAGVLRAEWCLLITGEVLARPDGNQNSGIPTGDIEIMGDTIVVLSESAPLPFPIDSGNDSEISEEVRLKYR